MTLKVRVRAGNKKEGGGEIVREGRGMLVKKLLPLMIEGVKS